MNTDISEQQLRRAIELYPDVIQRAYARRIKAEKKQAEAIERDVWRYDKLPKEVDHERGMTLEQLERLVQWKITHGASRPFLPAMIRKNDASAVLNATSASAKALSTLKASSSVSEALDITLSAMNTVSKLSGVGPATASLVLAVYKPELVPFFQDELWAWCLPEKAGTKLKYDKKEYETLFKKCWEIKHESGEPSSMVDLEKASYVLQHLDLLNEDEKGGLMDIQAQKLKTEAAKESAEPSLKGKITKARDTKRPASATQGGPENEDKGSDGPRRSKRTKK